MLMALVALSVDTILPAFGAIAAEFGLGDSNRRQWIISALFVGLAAGQLLYGPLSDSWGRKPAIYLGLFWFAVGSLISAVATGFEAMLLGRALQGFGAAGPRIVAVAMVRDRFRGVEMARVMSVVIAAFIMVPVFAPSLGQVVLWYASWRSIFVGVLAFGLLGGAWLALRQPETLPARLPFNARSLVTAAREVMRTRRSVAFTLAAACCYGALMGYVNSAQQIFQEVYGVGELFPFLFGACAVFVAAATLTNSALVARYRMTSICKAALIAATAWATAFLLAAAVGGGGLPLWLFLLFAGPVLFAIGLTFGNINAIALEPLGHIAGMASAVTATLSTVVSLVIGTVIGGLFDGTVVPVLAGYAVSGAAALALVAWGERAALRQRRGSG
ncbi:MAG TPA: multidrug effflux MFS transporter [Geminicoccaceae bacterium]